MERLEAHVPPPMKRSIKDFEEREGYENQSQAVRELLRRGLNKNPSPTFETLDNALGHTQEREVADDGP